VLQQEGLPRRKCLPDRSDTGSFTTCVPQIPDDFLSILAPQNSATAYEVIKSQIKSKFPRYFCWSPRTSCDT